MATDSPARPATGISMVPDQPVKNADEDRLGFAAYAGVFTAFFLDPQTPTPMSVAISGPWGAGKTSLAKLIDDRLRVRQNWQRSKWFEEPLTCWFNAWHHAGADNVGVALAAHVARALAPERHLWQRAVRPLPTAMLSPTRRWWRRIWQGVMAAVLAALVLMVLVWLVPSLRDKFGPVGSLPTSGANPVVLFAAGSALLALGVRAYKVGGTLGAFLEAPQEVAAKGSIAEVRENLRSLVKQALRYRERRQANRRLVIFIDDLERCPADKALGLCEVVSQLLDHPGVIVVLVSDLAQIACAAAARYQSTEGELPASVLGQRYLDKLINMRFNLPPLSQESVRRLFEPAGGV